MRIWTAVEINCRPLNYGRRSLYIVHYFVGVNKPIDRHTFISDGLFVVYTQYCIHNYNSWSIESMSIDGYL